MKLSKEEIDALKKLNDKNPDFCKPNYSVHRFKNVISEKVSYIAFIHYLKGSEQKEDIKYKGSGDEMPTIDHVIAYLLSN